MKYVTLNNGVKMPILGYGVYQISKEDCEQCVLDAIKVGYRSIDTARVYGNEIQTGKAIKKCGVPREEIFLTTKVWIDCYGYEGAKESVLQSLKNLQVDYIDLVLLHQPFSDYYGAYRALEDLYEQGLIRAIGVSNFYPDRLSDICTYNRIIPQVNQIEANPIHQRKACHSNMIKENVQMEAWAPLGQGRDNMLEKKELVEIGRAHNKTAAQVILRWLIQLDIVVLAKTVNIDRMKQNFDVFDFELSVSEMDIIAGLDAGKTMFMDHRTVEVVKLFSTISTKNMDKL